MKRNFLFMMDFRLSLLNFLLGTLIVNSLNSYGQSCDSVQCHCEKSDLNPSGIMLGHSHPKGVWMFSYRYMNMQMHDNVSGTKNVSDAIIFQNYIMSPKNMSMNMHMVMAMYGITDRLSVMAMFNYNVLSMNMNMLPGAMTMTMQGMTMPDMNATTMAYKTSGIGDTKLYAMYTLLDKSNQRLVLSAGVNIPTGSIQLKGNSETMMPGQRLPYMMQLGSGTFDLLPGITYLLSNEKFSWGTQVTSVLHTGYNSVGYAYGNEATASTWLAYKFFSWMSASLRAEADVMDRIYGKDNQLFEIMEPSAGNKNYGSKKVNGYAGLNFYLKQLANSKLSLEYGMPVYQNLNGTQLSTRSTFYAGWAVSF